MNWRHPLWATWYKMHVRCGNHSCPDYKNYGGRGIRVCTRWLNFDNFVQDMGDRPAGLLLDRVDNDGDYAPENCRWATRKQQNSNRRYCIYIRDGDELITLKEFCRRRNLRYRPIVKRIRDRNWPLALAVSLPVGQPRYALRKYLCG